MAQCVKMIWALADSGQYSHAERRCKLMSIKGSDKCFHHDPDMIQMRIDCARDEAEYRYIAVRYCRKLRLTVEYMRQEIAKRSNLQISDD